MPANPELHDLSSRIKSLEYKALRGRYAHETVLSLSEKISELQQEVEEEREKILEGEDAQRILDHLADELANVQAGDIQCGRPSLTAVELDALQAEMQTGLDACQAQTHAKLDEVHQAAAGNDVSIRAEFDTAQESPTRQPELPEPHEQEEAPASTPEVAQVAAAEVQTISGGNSGDVPAEAAIPEEEAPPADRAPAQTEGEKEPETAPALDGDEKPEVPEVSQFQRLIIHIAGLDAAETFDYKTLSAKLDILPATTRRYIPTLEAKGHIVRSLERMEGQLPQYTRTLTPDEQAAQVEQPPATASEPASGEPEPAERTPPPAPLTPRPEVAKPAQPAAAKPQATPERNLPRDLPPLKAPAGKAGALECEQVLGVLKERGRPMSLTMVVGRSRGLKQADVEAALHKLQQEAKVERDKFGFWKALP